jgi:hypothetical protein
MLNLLEPLGQVHLWLNPKIATLGSVLRGEYLGRCIPHTVSPLNGRQHTCWFGVRLPVFEWMSSLYFYPLAQ